MNGYKELLSAIQGQDCIILENEPMFRHTSFKIGGPADLFISINTEDSLVFITKKLNEYEIPFFLVGNGSNLLINDDGIRGAVIKLDGDFKKIRLSSRKKIVCGAGVMLSKLCLFAESNSLTGAEHLWGIPGTVGGALFMNAGAYGSEIKDIIVSSENLRKNGEIFTLAKEEMGLSYRYSAYYKTGDIALSATFGFNEADPLRIRKLMDDLLCKRKEKQPLEYPSAGSVFKRPNGNFAGALIEECNLKGTSIGGAKVSEKHAGFIINTGNATCMDVLKLIELIKTTVLNKTGVVLETEIKVID